MLQTWAAHFGLTEECFNELCDSRMGWPCLECGGSMLQRANFSTGGQVTVS